uniref:NUC153 domain-containing protein n=1 Tax=Angiostrongylus cantonensis TaxID=6313 RepID=A0A0K0DJI4_ANGCA
MNVLCISLKLLWKTGIQKKSGSERAVMKKQFDLWGVKKLPVSSKKWFSKELSNKVTLDKFGPGEANDEFDVDYSKEFTAEKKRRKSVKRTTDNDDGEGDEIDFESGSDDGDGVGIGDSDGSEENDDDMGEISEDGDDGENVEMESESEEEQPVTLRSRGKRDFYNSDESDDEIGENDADKAGEKVSADLDVFSVKKFVIRFVRDFIRFNFSIFACFCSSYQMSSMLYRLIVEWSVPICRDLMQIQCLFTWQRQ